MLKEIFEQERVVFDVIEGRYDEKNQMPYFEELQSLDLALYQHVMIIACGTSFHAAAIASYFFEEIAHIETKIEIASEYRYKTPIFSPHTLCIVLSQSGETADTIAALRKLKKMGMKVIALCNVTGSTIAREADATLFLRSGPEIAVASTKTFVAQLCVLFLLTIFLARQRGMKEEKAKALFAQLKNMPKVIAEILDTHREIQKLAAKYANYHDFYFLGRGVLYPTALEAALKLKEIAYINAVGYPAGEMKHGPIALLDSNVPVVVFCANHHLEKKIMSNLMESRARHAPIIVFGWNEFLQDFNPFCEDRLIIPQSGDELACISLTVASQLFAYFIARERKVDVDKPRNLAKSVTVE
jgi:glucosamine--fructose-6-phosphate aminotransferase (isomerizing)